MTCGLGKQNFSTIAEAREKLASLRQKKGKARAYWCPPCQCYHLTTKKKKQPYDREEEKRKSRKTRREIREGNYC